MWYYFYTLFNTDVKLDNLLHHIIPSSYLCIKPDHDVYEIIVRFTACPESQGISKRPNRGIPVSKVISAFNFLTLYDGDACDGLLYRTDVPSTPVLHQLAPSLCYLLFFPNCCQKSRVPPGICNSRGSIVPCPASEEQSMEFSGVWTCLCWMWVD